MQNEHTAVHGLNSLFVTKAEFPSRFLIFSRLWLRVGGLWQGRTLSSESPGVNSQEFSLAGRARALQGALKLPGKEGRKEGKAGNGFLLLLGHLCRVTVGWQCQTFEGTQSGNPTALELGKDLQD